jgi:prepilin-type processing-associated H-X9-DG protein
MSCTNNLKQIGLALLNYESTHGMFPASRTKKPEHSWTPVGLPYAEQANVAQLYNNKYDWDDPRNYKAVETLVTLFICPSAPGERHIADPNDNELNPAPGDYGSMNEVHRKFYQANSLTPPQLTEGVLAKLNYIRARDISDGLSNSIMIAECAGRPQRWVLKRYDEAHPIPLSEGVGWASPDCGFSLAGRRADGLGDSGPCMINCTNDSEIYSFHPGGANTCYADGSVHFLTESIQPAVLAGLSTRAGREVAVLDQ